MLNTLALVTVFSIVAHLCVSWVCSSWQMPRVTLQTLEQVSCVIINIVVLLLIILMIIVINTIVRGYVNYVISLHVTLRTAESFCQKIDLFLAAYMRWLNLARHKSTVVRHMKTYTNEITSIMS